MKRLYKILTICLTITIVNVMAVNIVNAQTPVVLDMPGGGGVTPDGGGGTSDGAVVPFDGGLSLILLAGGVGFMSRKVKEQAII